MRATKILTIFSTLILIGWTLLSCDSAFAFYQSDIRNITAQIADIDRTNLRERVPKSRDKKFDITVRNFEKINPTATSTLAPAIKVLLHFDDHENLEKTLNEYGGASIQHRVQLAAYYASYGACKRAKNNTR